MASMSGSVVPQSWPAVIVDGLGVRLRRASPAIIVTSLKNKFMHYPSPSILFIFKPFHTLWVVAEFESNGAIMITKLYSTNK
jgi:hypothetical protein